MFKEKLSVQKGENTDTDSYTLLLCSDVRGTFLRFLSRDSITVSPEICWGHMLFTQTEREREKARVSL